MTDTPILTKEFCEKNRIRFYPKDIDEAHHIQTRLFLMGFRWSDGDKRIKLLDLCVRKGLLLEDGYVYTHPRKKRHDVIACAAQFPPLKQMDPLPGRDELLLEFNRMAERMAALEAQMAQLAELVTPKKIDKPLSLSVPGK